MMTKLMTAICALAGMAAFGVTMPEVVSHRGESKDRPENTMAAFRLAFERGVDGVECDVYCTSDGVPVIIHDSTTGRTAGSGVNLTVTSSTWDQLTDVQVGKFSPWIGTEWESETLPKFSDYLALLSMNTTTKCIVELKGNGANNLVAKVVEAVQAQPLATKDRVAFIAFDASLISAVRAALPDYDALLLLSNVSDSSATLNSKIAACNGTGVDIHYQAAAAQSAAEIQAVKAAGYKFWVWTCDDVNESFALASRGVQSVTTNKGGDTKTAVAAMIAEAESREEIVEPNFPAGVTLMEPSAYVQTGLVGHFDAIRNVGMNLPHDNSATTWKNLASGGPDATFTHRSNSPSPGYWTDKSYYFNNGTMASTVSALNLGNNFTVQIAINASPSGQTATTTSANGSNNYHAWFNDHPKGNRGFWTYSHKNGNNGKDLVGNFDKFGGPRINIVNWGGKYVTWMLDGANGKAYTFEDAAIPTSGSLVQGMTVKTSNISSKHCWGGEQEGTRLQAFLKGDYYSVRMYNRVLTNDEHVWNRIVDEVRYRGVVTNGTVVVASNRAGADGTESSGTYYVNGNHTFTVPASVTIDGCVYEPTGYKLETYNASTKTWNFVEERTDLSFAYTNCAVNTGARITWNWRLASGVKKVDADDYVQGGLVAHFDGIRNAGLDVAHSADTTVWKNLASWNDATKSTFDAARPGEWGAKGYNFDAGECFVLSSQELFTRQATLQVATDYNPAAQAKNWPHLFGYATTDTDRFNLYTYRANAAETSRGDQLVFNAANLMNQTVGILPWDGRTANAILDYDKTRLFDGVGTENTSNGSRKADMGAQVLAIAAGQSSAANRSARSFVGPIYSVRLYDRVLTANEIKRNSEIDHIRFYSGAGHSTEVGLVEVVSEIPSIEVADAGCWFVCGEGVTKTFSVPASVTAGGGVYSCAGYRVETWNATKKMWENPVDTAGATSVEIAGASGAVNRRITWLWTATKRLRAAADYGLADYVQQGLVANYDGIFNNGPGNAHTTKGMYWRDSSYRDVPMLAASNTAFYAWTGSGHRFNLVDDSVFKTVEPIDLGWACTIQSVMDAPPGATQSSGRPAKNKRSGDGAHWPTYFGIPNDHGMFTDKAGTELAWKMDNFLYDNSSDYPRARLTGFQGKYINAVVDGISANKVYLTQTATLGSGVKNKKKAQINGQVWAIGGPNADYENTCWRTISGDYYAFRIYNRALSEAELAQNMKVDEIRYRGNFANYRNITVVTEIPFEGLAAPSSVAEGDYEVTGEWTFEAGNLAIDGVTFPPRYTIETYENGAWSEPVEYEGGSYTYEPEQVGKPVRLTWKWIDANTPVAARWTGGGDVGNLLDPANWSCLNAVGEALAGAVPGSLATVFVDSGSTTFSIPEGTATLPWKEIKFCADFHSATRCGNFGLNTTAEKTTLPAGRFALFPDANLKNIQGNGTSWMAANLAGKRVRYDGWFYVTAAQAGTWTLNAVFDDYYCFAIDGEWVMISGAYNIIMGSSTEVPEGWHRFTIVCGDTGGGYGGQTNLQVGGAIVPMSITHGAGTVAFAEDSFQFGTGRPEIVLDADCDWRALGDLLLQNGAAIDLNGHNLSLASISSDYLGAMITNSNDAVLSTVTFTAPEGGASTNGVAICGNVKVVKKGAGAYCAYATGCTYTGGTFIDEGTAQPPDGSGADTLYCWDQFKAFGLGEIVVAEGATFDIRANYAYRDRVVLVGGTFTNSKADMTSTGYGGSGIGRLEANSFLKCVPYSIVFGDANGRGDMDLGGKKLTMSVASGKTLYVRCSKIENGTIDITSGGWLQTVVPCVASNVDFRVNCALRVNSALSVRDYDAVYDNPAYTEGTAALNVYGAFRPDNAAGCFYGCTMQDGSTIDLSVRTGAFSTQSAFTKGSTSLLFAAGATVAVKLAGREDLREFTDADSPCIVTWSAEKAPPVDVTFVPDAVTKRQGYKFVRDDEAHGLRLVHKGGTTVFVR